MRAELKRILPNNHLLDWDAWVSAGRTRPHEDHGWFTLDIGPEGEPSSDVFQVNVSTAPAASRARGRGEREFRGFVVESFEPEVIARVLHA